MEAVVTLNENSPGVKYLCAKDKRLAKAISMVGTISYIPHDDEYAFLIHEIIEQKIALIKSVPVVFRFISGASIIRM